MASRQSTSALASDDEREYQQAAVDRRPRRLSSEDFQSYREPVNPAVIQRNKQKSELSFFAHLAGYALLLPLFLSLGMAFLPFIIAAPLGLLIPLGIVLGASRLWKQHFLDNKK